MLDAVLARFVAACPVAVMARLAVQRALSPAWVDAVFEAQRERQYTRELLFSTVVELMELVALGLRPSLHAAAQRARADGTLAVSLQALYDKVNHAEPVVLRALVQGSAARLRPVRTAAGVGVPSPQLPGYRLRVFDGNHLPATEKRVKPLRGRRTAALPGQTLVVYDPELDLVVDLIAEPDAFASERTLVPAAVAAAGPGELWIGDRNYATRPILTALGARGAAVLVREHATQPHPTAAGARQRLGRCPTGVVYEQAVDLPTAAGGAEGLGSVLRLRRIEVELDTPTEAGDTLVRLLTTVPNGHADAATLAMLYLTRWRIEGLFQRLEAVLHSEVRTLGQPRAALLAFSVAVLAYNGLALVQAVLDAHATATAAAVPNTPPIPLSLFYIAQDIREHYRGMLVAIPAGDWARYDDQSPAQLAQTLRHLATHVRLAAFRKHPRAARPRRKKGYAPRAEVQRKIATARVLDQQQQRRRSQGP